MKESSVVSKEGSRKSPNINWRVRKSNIETGEVKQETQKNLGGGFFKKHTVYIVWLITS